jgi:hypothetical protein
MIWRWGGYSAAEPPLEASRLAAVPGRLGFAQVVLRGPPRGSHRQRRRAGRRTVPSADCEALADWGGKGAPVEWRPRGLGA